MPFELGTPVDIATQGFLTGLPLNIGTQGFINLIIEEFGDVTLGGCAPQISVIGGVTTFYYPASDGAVFGGEAAVTVKIGGQIDVDYPASGGLVTGGVGSWTVLLDGKLIATHQASGGIRTGGEASVVAKVSGQTSVIYTAQGILLMSGTAKQEFVAFLKTIFPPQPPLPGPPDPPPLRPLPSDVDLFPPITQFQKDDISSGLLELGGCRMHVYPLQLFGNRDWEFVILLRPWSIAVDFAIAVWVSDTPLGKPVGRKVHITFREITYFYIKEKTLEVWQGEERVFHAIIDLPSQGNYFLHIDNLENRKVNKYAMKIETYIYGQTIFDGDTTIFDLVNDTETVFDKIGEFGQNPEGDVEL